MHRGTVAEPPPLSHYADAVIMCEVLRTRAPVKHSAPGMKTLEGSDESARVSSRGRLATSLLGGVALVACEAAEGSELSSRWLDLVSCQHMPAASSCTKRFNAPVGEGLGFRAEDFPRPRRTARPPWWKCVCSAEALAAAPAAKDVDAKENGNGTIDTCHESEKNKGTAPGARRPPFSGEKTAPRNGQF